MGVGSHHLLSAPGILTLLLSSHKLGSLTLTRHPFKSSAVSASGSAASPLSLPALLLGDLSPAGLAFSMSSVGCSGAEVTGASGSTGLLSGSSFLTSASGAAVSGCPGMLVRLVRTAGSAG